MAGIELEIEHQGDCTVHAFAVGTRQVLLNLARNACEATERRGARVSISMEGRAKDVRIVVAVEGSGMGPEMTGRLFQFGVSTRGN